MKHISLILSFCLSLQGTNLVLATGTDSNWTQIAAGNCTQKANKIASGYAGAQVLSIEQSGSGSGAKCVIVIRVPGQNGKQPRIVRKTVSG